MFVTSLKILFFFFIFLLFFSFWGFYLAIRPSKIISIETPKTLGVAFEPVSFYTKDKLLIRGWFIPSATQTNKTIILLHGYPADKGDILPSRIFLHADFNLLFFDFRYFGESAGNYSTVGKNEVEDLLAAIKYLQSRNLKDIGVWGLSFGGAIALMTAAQTNAIKAIVSESSFARLDWLANNYYNIPVLRYPLVYLTTLWAKLFLNIDITQVAPVNAAEQLRIPILIIHSKQDNVIPFTHAQLFEKALANHPHAEFFITDQEKHGQLSETEKKIIRAFFKKNL